MPMKENHSKRVKTLAYLLKNKGTSEYYKQSFHNSEGGDIVYDKDYSDTTKIVTEIFQRNIKPKFLYEKSVNN